MFYYMIITTQPLGNPIKYKGFVHLQRTFTPAVAYVYTCRVLLSRCNTQASEYNPETVVFMHFFQEKAGLHTLSRQPRRIARRGAATGGLKYANPVSVHLYQKLRVDKITSIGCQ